MGPKSPGPCQARPVHQAVLGPPIRPAGRHGTARQNDLGPVRPGHSNGRPAPPPRLPTVGSERPRPRLPAPAQTTPPALYDPARCPSPTLTVIPIHSRHALAPACHPLRRSDSSVARRASPRWTSPRRLVLHHRVATSSSPPLSFSLTSSSPVCSSLSTASSSSSPPSSVELVFFHLSGAGLRLCRQVHPPQDLNPSL